MDGLLIFFLFAGLIAAVVHGISVYNKLNPLREELKEAEGNIEVVMHKVAGLTEKLVGLATRYGFHEQNIHLQISADRRKAQESIYQRTLQAITMISGFAANFPTLKADQTYLRLMGDLSVLATETQQKYEDYNRRAKIYNTERTGFPAIISSGILGFTKASYLNPTRWYPAATQKTIP
jgi:LemA protein